MKFHKQLKVPGLNKEQIIEGLESTGMKMRPMREEYYGQKKFKPTNTMSDFNIIVEDELIELQGGGDYNVWSFVPYLARDLLGMTDKYLTTRYTKSDIGYERNGWEEHLPSGMKRGTKYVEGATGEEKIA